MKYSSASAFRRALEDRLRQQGLQSGVPLVRLRKMIAFDRFLARLVQVQPNQWVVKGGFALQLRLGQRARTTKDIDLLMLDQQQDVYFRLSAVGATVLDDWFSFEVSRIALSATENFGGDQYQVLSLLDGRRFEGFHLDVGVGDHCYFCCVANASCT
ncbi:MAG: nucleotidyl transferase AbiEii/AbiGii toxin family protein [Chloroflexota bacterium]